MSSKDDNLAFITPAKNNIGILTETPNIYIPQQQVQHNPQPLQPSPAQTPLASHKCPLLLNTVPNPLCTST